MVVLPDDSGPKISITRPRGTPPTPSAASNEIDPVEMTEMGTIASLLPRRMMEPFPNCFSICERASSTARERSSAKSVSNSGAVFSSKHTPSAEKHSGLEVRACLNGRRDFERILTLKNAWRTKIEDRCSELGLFCRRTVPPTAQSAVPCDQSQARKRRMSPSRPRRSAGPHGSPGGSH